MSSDDTFIKIIVTYFFGETCLPIKILLSQTICDICKQFDQQVLDVLVLKAHYI